MRFIRTENLADGGNNFIRKRLKVLLIKCQSMIANTIKMTSPVLGGFLSTPSHFLFPASRRVVTTSLLQSGLRSKGFSPPPPSSTEYTSILYYRHSLHSTHHLPTNIQRIIIHKNRFGHNLQKRHSEKIVLSISPNVKRNCLTSLST